MGFMPQSFMGFPSLSQTYLGIKDAQKDRDAVARANEANIDLANQQSAKQMAFQNEMSSTAHQREVADLKAAGLNPLLSMNSGASTPSGSSALAQVEPVIDRSYGAAQAGLGHLGNSAMNVVTMLSDLQEQGSRTALNTDLGRKAAADAGLASTTAEKMSADAYIENLKRRALEKITGTAKQVFSNPSNVFSKGSESRIPGSYLDILP